MSTKEYARWQEESIFRALKTRRVLILAGPRQCGKTTLAQKLSLKNIIYRTLDDTTFLEAALNDPQGFVHHDDELMIIDEIQRAPILLQAIKQDVDKNKKYGRFLLTGSANIQSLPGVTESLAGRVRKIRLRTLTLGEIHNTQPNFLTKAFSGSLFQEKNKPNTKKTQNKKNYLLEAFVGGFPEAITLNAKEMRRWHFDYLDALMERDLKDILNIKRQDVMKDLLHTLAAWSSKFMDVSSICSSFAVSRQTIESYINAIEALYLVERVKPWSKTDYDRVSKHDKIFMADTGLMTSLLKWNREKIEFDGEKNGKLMETFIFTQLSAILDAQDESYNLYHYRDREQREIDFIIENEEGHLLGIEVKAGSSVNKECFKHLKWFQEKMALGNPFTGIVFYTGENTVSFGNSMFAVPINVLWSR